MYYNGPRGKIKTCDHSVTYFTAHTSKDFKVALRQILEEMGKNSYLRQAERADKY